MLNNQYCTIQNTQAKVFFAYSDSELLALHLGYVEVAHASAYRGRYFFKNGKKWIHNIKALTKRLSETYGRYISEEELSAPEPEGFGYDVEAYYAYNAQNSLSNNVAFQHWVDGFRIH